MVSTWLGSEDHGVDDFVGVDGGHVAADTLEIALSNQAHDRSLLDLGRRFDLVGPLEVAEHLGPHAIRVRGLAGFPRPAVLFAAIRTKAGLVTSTRHGRANGLRFAERDLPLTIRPKCGDERRPRPRRI